MERETEINSGLPPWAWDDLGTGLSPLAGIKNRYLLEMERERETGKAGTGYWDSLFAILPNVHLGMIYVSFLFHQQLRYYTEGRKTLSGSINDIVEGRRG